MDINRITTEGLDLKYLKLHQEKSIYYQLSPAALIEQAILNGEGKLADSGAFAADTGEFTGRSPKDRYIVYDDITKDTVWWGDINIPFSTDNFDSLYSRVCRYLGDKDIYVRDCYACAAETYRMDIRIVSETAYQNLFANNLFLRPEPVNSESQPEWTIVTAPGFLAVPERDGSRQHNFSIINFSSKIILIGGTGYTGEIKKGIFSALNFILLQQHQVLSMHCSANMGMNDDTALFFGLSGTGKTTLSADPDRALIGDDEHGWDKNTVFNFEGGCYAKCVDLSQEKEPQIFKAVKFGSLLENINFFENTRKVDFSDIQKTENTRVAYPIDFIDNAIIPSIAPGPKNIFFLTADAFGVLPPISRLSRSQAMYHFISGYTAKVAGTEADVAEPQLTFSACFGKAFLPLHPAKYAELFGIKMIEGDVKVWLVNTGWTGGVYGIGTRMKLSYTRAMIRAALNNDLNLVQYQYHPVFDLAMPMSCPGVPSEILNPRTTWNDKDAYDQNALILAQAFVSNFKQYEEFTDNEIISANPKVFFTV